MDTQNYRGQILGTYNNEPISIKVDSNGHLILSSLPAGNNNIGQVLSGFQNISVLTSAERTISGESIEIDCGKYKEAIAFLDVTAVSGTTPTLDIKFQTQDPVSLKWFNLTDLTFTQVTSIISEMKSKINGLGSKIKCVYTIGGTTPSFTFSVGLILKS